MSIPGNIRHHSTTYLQSQRRYSQELMVDVFCHSYPFATARADVIDGETLLLHCDLTQVPHHAFIEVGFELYIDGGIQYYRFPVYQVGKGERGLVRFSFSPEIDVVNALEPLGRQQQEVGMA